MFINKANNNSIMKKYLIISIFLISGAFTNVYAQTKEHDVSGMDKHMEHAQEKTVKRAPKKVTVKKQPSKSTVRKKVATQPAKSSAKNHNMDPEGMEMGSGAQKKDSTHKDHMQDIKVLDAGNDNTKDTMRKSAHTMSNMDHSNMSGMDNKDDTSKKKTQGMGNMNMHNHSNMNHDTMGHNHMDMEQWKE
jgi:hypothetical protein